MAFSSARKSAVAAINVAAGTPSSKTSAESFFEQPLHRAVDVFGIAERVAALCGANSPIAPRPAVHILKQVMMNLAVMGGREFAGRQGLFSPQRGHFQFEGFKQSRVANAGFVLQNKRALEWCSASNGRGALLSLIGHEVALIGNRPLALTRRTSRTGSADISDPVTGCAAAPPLPSRTRASDISSSPPLGVLPRRTGKLGP
jgi:hypothetical protein